MRRALGLVAVLLAAVAASGCGSDAPATPATTTTARAAAGSVAPARFAKLPAGWRSFGSDPVPLTRQGAVTATFATSWAYSAGAHGPAGEMPTDGAMVSVMLLRRNDHGARPVDLCARVPASPDYPPRRRLPARIAGMRRSGHLEGSPTVAEHSIQASRGRDYRIDLRVDLAPRADHAAADRALAAIRLPRWGRRC